MKIINTNTKIKFFRKLIIVLPHLMHKLAIIQKTNTIEKLTFIERLFISIKEKTIICLWLFENALIKSGYTIISHRLSLI